ncbi:hypothetical protein V8D89_013524 [Ganoderma adspersum]
MFLPPLLGFKVAGHLTRNRLQLQFMPTSCPSASQGATPATHLASSPFNKPDADIILRSGDGVDFCVRRHILFEASPVFESILSIPQPSTDVRPIVELVEDEKTLDTILRICYPIVKPKASVQVEEVERAVKVAQKYEMELPLSVLMDELLELAKTSPFAVWAVGCRTGLERVARHAAAMLKEPLEVEVSHLNGVSAGDYFRLLDFHRKGGEAVETFAFLALGETSEERFAPAAISLPPNMPHPDLICVSSDGVEIPVHKACVGSASPVLRERIDKASNINEAGHPILLFNEQSGLLADLLKLCYPDRNLLDLLTDPSKLADILVALDTYKMGSIRRAVFGIWKTAAETDPIRTYLAAARRRLRDCAEVAAKCALQHPIEGRYEADMEFSPAAVYHHLLAYHASCRGVVKQLLREVLPPPTLKSKVNEHSDQSETEAAYSRLYAKSRELKSKKVIRTPVPAAPLRTPQDIWLESYVESLIARADTHWDHPPSSPTAFEVTITKGNLWCTSCRNFAMKLSACDATVQSTYGRIAKVPLVF